MFPKVSLKRTAIYSIFFAQCSHIVFGEQHFYLGRVQSSKPLGLLIDPLLLFKDKNETIDAITTLA
jgi:hypothetical protein